MNSTIRSFIPDFIFFLFLAVAGEFIAVGGLKFFSAGFYFSIALLPLMIFLYRWGLPALPALVFFGIASALMMPGSSIGTVAVNGAGYCGLAGGLILLRTAGRERIRASAYFALLYMFVAWGFMVVLRAVILSLFEGGILSGLLLVGANESLSFIASSILFLLMRRRPGLLIYLPALIEESENEGPPEPWRPEGL